ncbi:MAG: tetratricopeptide repeat protein [Planctomycetes bacterium]|nr:tetratricopeptide repeat protein [Planctomycetota bacterium]
MAMRREQVIFIITLGLTGLLGWQLYAALNDPVQSITWPKKDRKVAAQRVPDITQFPTLTVPGPDKSKRDLFTAPTDSHPLPKLQLGPALPPPSPDSVEWLMPPTTPAPGMRLWHLYLRMPARVDKFDFAEAAAAAKSAAEQSNAESPNPTNPSTAQYTQNATTQSPGAQNPTTQNPAAAPKSAAEQAAEQAAQAQLDEETLAKRYDRLNLKEAPLMWGRILNPKKYEIKDDEAIVFQIYDKISGRAFGKPLTRQRADVISYQLAKTIRNDIEIKKRKVIWGAGNESKIREFGLWCLSLGDDEPFAIEESGRQLKKAVELAPQDPANQLALGRWHEANYHYEDAWKLYRSMTEGDFRANPEAWVARAELERRLHLDKDAQLSLERAATLDSSNYLPKLVLGEFYLLQGRANEAASALDASFRNEPTGVGDATIRARIRRRLAEAQLAIGNIASAGELFEKARNADPNDGVAATGSAVVMMLNKQTAPAMELLNATIAAKPAAGALLARGILKLASKDYPGAKADFEAAIGLDPVRDVRPLSALAFLYIVTDHRDEAMATIERALQNDPTDAYAHYLRGRLRRDAGESEAAREDQKFAVMADLGFVEPLMEMGLLAAAQDLYEAADRYYAKAAEFDVKNANLFALRGLNLLLWQQTRRAKDTFITALRIDRDNPVARIGQALCEYMDDNTMAMNREFGTVRDSRADGDRFKTYAIETLQKISIHDHKQEWVDTFERIVLGNNNWTLIHVPGVDVKDVMGEARIEGEFGNAGISGINCSTIKCVSYCSLEATLNVQPAGKTPAENRVDVITYLRAFKGRDNAELDFEIAIVREKKRIDGSTPVKIRLRNARVFEGKQEIEIPFQWPVDKVVTVRIEVSDDDSAPLGRVIIDNQIVKSDIKFPRERNGMYDLGVETSGDTGSPVSVSIDTIKVVTRENP